MKTTDTTAIERDHIIRSLQGSDWKIIRAVRVRQQDRTLEFMMLVTFLEVGFARSRSELPQIYGRLIWKGKKAAPPGRIRGAALC